MLPFTLKRYLLLLLAAGSWLAGRAEMPDPGERCNIAGTVVNAKTKKPVPQASIALDGGERWTVTGEDGTFILKNINPGEVTLTVSCLGYAKRTIKVPACAGTPVTVALPEDNLLLGEVIISARAGGDDATSSYVIDRASLEHLQMLDVTDAMSLLPGGQINRTLHLAGNRPQHLLLRSATGENGNPTFTTAVEVDGVRLSNNAAFNTTAESSVQGVDIRPVASNNISSIEVITGVPPVEYGDLSNGVVKINTMKGASPFNIVLLTKPNTKQASVNKGFDLGSEAGVLNASLERTRSIADLASPYTSYDRNVLSLSYSNTFNRNSRPLALEAGITGNTGGYNSKDDPDRFVDTYTRVRDNALRASLQLRWLLDKAWLTGLEASAAVSYADKLTETKANKSSSAALAAIHGREEGYFVASLYDENPDAAIVLLPAGYWYQLRYVDSKPLNITANLKAKWAHAFGKARNNVLLGVDFSAAGNKGRGEYYDDLRYAPTWREYRFDRVPFVHNVAAYAEEKINLPAGRAALLLVAGARLDMTLINRPEHGAAGSLSPRFNARYTLDGQPGAWLRKLTLTAGWGKAVKLPSFEVLYPRPGYEDRLAFAPGSLADGTSFVAYHITPYTPGCDPNLRWQHSRQWEAGVEAKIHPVLLSLTFFHHQTIDPYRYVNEYTPFAYKLTGQEALEQSAIPPDDRQYGIDREAGIVTATDKTGARAPEVLAYKERRTFRDNRIFTNGTPFVRRGVEWVVDFGKLPLLQTSVRLDGNYYHYRSADETIAPYSPMSQNMADGNPYKYVGYYVGAAAAGNGFETKQANLNLTLATHIPAIRIIVSLRVEATLYNFRQNLSEYSAGVRGFAVDNRGDNFPAADPSRYNSSRYVAVYPLYYTTCEDMDTKIPFAETYAWAAANRAHDPQAADLYNNLTSLVEHTPTDYYFNANKISSYYSVNLSVTKELGDLATLSFSATNFTNTARQVTESDTGLQLSLYNGAKDLIPKFYYSLSLKIKL
jgi:hypothetical protein